MSSEGNKWEGAASHNLLALFTFQDWQHVRDLLGVMQKDMKAALRTAVRQTGQWANREGARGIARAANVPMSVLRKGLRIKFKYQSVKGFSTARLWYGLNPIGANYLSPRINGSAVTVRGQTYNDAFVAKGRANGQIFQRVSAGRYPIKRVEYDIEKNAADFLFKFEKTVAEKFVSYFFAALDKSSGRDEGESQAIAGRSNISQR